MRVFYSTIFYLLIPFILLRLTWRGFKAPDYWSRWPERFAFYKRSDTHPLIWFHAVSVGEAEAVFPLVKRVLQKHPQYKVLITTTTPTGSARVKAVMSDTVEHVYLPYDLPGAVFRFMNHFKPVLAVIMETEIWPNLYAQCGRKSIPLYIVNARLSEKSARGYQKVPWLAQPALANVNVIAAQTPADGDRFARVGAKPGSVQVTGNIKFDLEIADTIIKQGKVLRATQFPDRLVLILASSHKGEEEIFLQAYRLLKQQFSRLILVIVPRHPERFGPVKKRCMDAGYKVITRTSEQHCSAHTDIYLADTMGELKMLYAAADVAFVGGSMAPVGGHNVLEPAALGVAAIFGPYMSNFKEIAAGLLNAEAAMQCQNRDELIESLTQLLGDESLRQNLAANGQAFVQSNQGALQQVSQIIGLAI